MIKPSQENEPHTRFAKSLQLPHLLNLLCHHQAAEPSPLFDLKPLNLKGGGGRERSLEALDNQQQPANSIMAQSSSAACVDAQLGRCTQIRRQPPPLCNVLVKAAQHTKAHVAVQGMSLAAWSTYQHHHDQTGSPPRCVGCCWPRCATPHSAGTGQKPGPFPKQSG